MRHDTDIVIDNEATLTITGTLSMAEGKKITVMAGAEIRVNGGTITNGCGKFWGGIYVKGDPDGQSDDPGIARILGGATIEYARSGVNNFIQTASGEIDWNTTGGLISANNASFINNKRDVQFLKFQNTNGSGDPIRDYSLFTLTDFIVNDDFTQDEDPIPNVSIYKCLGVKIQGCNFRDSRSGLESYEKREGIYVLKGSVTVDDISPCSVCPAVPTTFSNLSKGLFIESNGSVLFNTTVKNSEFKSCWRGVYIWGNANTELLLNEFEVTAHDEYNNEYPVGVYLHSKTRDYIIEENNFYHQPNSIKPPAQGAAVGIVANTALDNNEEIYRNNFRNLTVGFESIGKNKYTDEEGNFYSGLRIKCNNFSEDSRDMYLVKGNENFNQYGIATNQGTASTDELAFNTFVPNSYMINIDNELLISDEGSFNYVYSSGVSEEEPVVAFITDIADPNTNVFLALSDYNGNDKCPANYGNIGIGIGKERKASAIALGIQKENEMAQVLDGGDTDGLQTDVALTTDTEAWKRYMDLMSKSGYITEPVLEELTTNENGFTKAMTRNVLVANPHSAKSITVTEALDLRADPLPEYMREQIKMGLTQISTKEFLTMQRDRYKLNQDKAVKRMYLTLLKDSIPTDSMQTFVDILSGNNDIRYDYKLVELYDAVGQDYLGDALLSAMENYDLPLEKLEELGRYKSYRSLMKQWEVDGKNELMLDEADLQVLEGYAEFNDKAGVEAITILRVNDAIAIEEPVFINEDDKKLSSMKPKESSTLGDMGKGELSLYPNPADDYFTVQYRIDEVFQNALFRIIDVKGIVVFEQKLNYEEDQIIIKRSSELNTGTYQCEISIDGNVYFANSIVLR